MRTVVNIARSKACDGRGIGWNTSSLVDTKSAGLVHNIPLGQHQSMVRTSNDENGSRASTPVVRLDDNCHQY